MRLEDKRFRGPARAATGRRGRPGGRPPPSVSFSGGVFLRSRLVLSTSIEVPGSQVPSHKVVGPDVPLPVRPFLLLRP